MQALLIALQVVVALGILNVWLLRGRRSTPYRGGSASNLREEFAVYGLPPAAMFVVGALKLLCALALLAGLVAPELIVPAASLPGLLMIGAIGMHIKAKDSMHKSVPAAVMLLMCLGILLLARGAA